MHKPSMGIAPEGFPFVLLLALSSIVFAIIDCWPVAVLFLAGTWFAGHFFRDPERVPPEDPSAAVSPADGRIIRIEERPNPFGDGSCQCVSIFMNVFNVHVNRSPVAGIVEKVRYIPGTFVNASFDKASTDNERCIWRLRDEQGCIWDMVQIAGLVARRIVPRAEEGDALARGQRYGLIRFGSRVDLYLPAAYTCAVQLGSKVVAGETVIAVRAIPAGTATERETVDAAAPEQLNQEDKPAGSAA